MKSIFQKPVYQKEYYIRENLDINHFNRFVTYVSNPTIEYYTNLVEHNTFYETDLFDRMFLANEKVCLDDQVYTIDEIIYGVDYYIYRVKECDYIENDIAKQIIIDEYNKRKEEELEKLRIEKEEQDKRIQEYNESTKEKEEEVLDIKNSKKWWQIWK